MDKKEVSSFKIVQHHKHSWGYTYIINGKRRDISGSSLHDLKRQVLYLGLQWDEENYPDERITKSKYDSNERINEPKKSNEPIYKGPDPLEKELKLPQWAPSMK